MHAKLELTTSTWAAWAGRCSYDGPYREQVMRSALVLKALTHQPTHGWGIGLRIGEISKGRLDVNQGSLYPALQRLEHRGWIESEWRSTENNRRARYYSITRQGRKALGEEVDKWKRFAATMTLILDS